MPIYIFSKRHITVEDGVYNPLLKKGHGEGSVVILIVNDIEKLPLKKEQYDDRK
jgi:hypothetical protein